MCCSCGMCYDSFKSDYNLTSLVESHASLNMSDDCGDDCVNSGGFCYAGTCYSPAACEGKCDDADCETCFCGNCLGSSAGQDKSTAGPSYINNATLASGGLAAVCLLGVFGRWSLRNIKSRQYEKLCGSTEELSIKEVKATPTEFSQEEMCYQNVEIGPDINISQVY